MRSGFYSFLSVVAALALGASVSSFARQQGKDAAPAGQGQGAPAQTRPSPEPATGAQDEGPIFIREVRVQVTVTDKKGQPVSGLTQSDFQVFEDKRPQEIASFRDEREMLPVYVGVLMDTSASTAGKLKFEQEAAMNFIHTVVRLRKDKVAFLTFDHEVNLRQDFTDKLDLLDRAVYNVKKPGTQTSLYDAVWLFCNEKLRGLGNARRAVVVITDGDDTYSRATLKDAVDIAQRTETIVYAISTKAGFAGAVPGVEAGQVNDGGDKELVKLCEETGGKAFFTGDLLELERSFTKISKELRSHYTITYKPANNQYDGSYRRIEVKLADKRDGLRVSAKRGYTAVRDTGK